MHYIGRQISCLCDQLTCCPLRCILSRQSHHHIRSCVSRRQNDAESYPFHLMYISWMWICAWGTQFTSKFIHLNLSIIALSGQGRPTSYICCKNQQDPLQIHFSMIWSYSHQHVSYISGTLMIPSIYLYMSMCAVLKTSGHEAKSCKSSIYI